MEIQDLMKIRNAIGNEIKEMNKEQLTEYFKKQKE